MYVWLMKIIVVCSWSLFVSCCCFGQNGKDAGVQKLTEQKLVGTYEGKEPYCRLSVKIKRNHHIKVFRQCEANRPYRERATWRIENDTVIVSGWFDEEPQKWVLIKNCLYHASEKDENLIGCKD